MKKYLVSSFVLLALTACNRVDSISQSADSAITFADSFVEVKTRLAEDPSITTATIDAFDVWATIDNATMILDEERVTKGADGWKYDNLQYWLGSHTYFFGAIAPVDHANITVDTKNIDENGLGTVTFTNLDGTDDLIYASKIVVTADDVVKNDPGKVQLQFAHLLSKVKFTFVNGFASSNYKIAVKNIRMTVPKAGTINLAQVDWRLNSMWDITADGLVLDFGDVNKGAKMAITDSQECDFERLTIPDETNYTITFDVALYIGDYAVPVYEVSRTVNTVQDLKIGKSYNFKTILGPDNINPDGPLRPIEFDVLEVEIWDEKEIYL